VCPRIRVSDGGQDQTYPFAAPRGDRPFAKLLWRFVSILSVCGYACLFRPWYSRQCGCTATQFAAVMCSCTSDIIELSVV